VTIEDLSALAARLAAGVGDVRGCLIVSRDGLVMGAYPDDAEAQLKPAWLRFAAVGEPDRSFVQFGDEIWCYVRRGAYAAFVVTSVGVRPGLVIDQIEQLLLTAEAARSRGETLRVPEAPAAPSSKPRTPLHSEPTRMDDPVLIRSETAAVGAPSVSESALDPSAASDEPDPEVPTGLSTSRDPSSGSAGARRSDDVSDDASDDEVDRVLLAREFSRLLQDDERGADG
jgi:predicted regulator of Ras-like GTPase activity (Roadblock/LC7/MglB family)